MAVIPWPLPLTSKHGSFSSLLDFCRYLVRREYPTYVRSKARQLRRRRRLLDGPFHVVALFDGSGPFAVLALPTRFRTAAVEMDVTLVEAPYLLAYRLGGEAKDDCVRKTNGRHGSAVRISFPHTMNYMLTLYAPKDTLHSSKMAARALELLDDKGERAVH